MRRLIASVAVLFAVAACNATPQVNTGTVTGPGNSAAGAAAEQKAPTWGQTYTWPDGIAVEISQPTGCKPGKWASPQNPPRVVRVTYKITNGSDKPFEIVGLSVLREVQFAGARAETLVDSEGPCKAGIGLESATVLPGKSFSYAEAYVVAAEPGELQISMQPTMTADKAVFVGQA